MARGKSFCLLPAVLRVSNTDPPPCTHTFGGLYSSRRGKLEHSAATTIGGSVVIVAIVGTVGILLAQGATIREERIPHDQHSEHPSRFLFSQR